ncbi:hypothetical protein SLS62_010778 [Diatrype stigma]|uniref:Uncharacterized protein n=1 Tax=Diatrype stigma TaxID=117547 RepID=A0AAN9YH99_9PEZI
MRVSNTTTSSSSPVRPSTSNTVSLSTSSGSLTSTIPSGSASLIVETLTEPNGPIVTVTLPTSASITGLETLTISGSTLTVEPISITSSLSSTPSASTSNVETFTEPDGSSVAFTLPPGSTLTGLQTITTDGQTLTIQPVPTSVTIASTMTTVPASLSIEPFTETPVTGNMWLTTTGNDHSTTIVPVILPCPTCEPEIVWNVPEIPNVDFTWPTVPQLPEFHLPCVKIFGITLVRLQQLFKLIGLQRNPKRACCPPSVDCTNCDLELNVGFRQFKHCKSDVIHSREYRLFSIALFDDIALFDSITLFHTLSHTLFDNIVLFNSTADAHILIHSDHHNSRADCDRVRKLLCLDIDNHAL